ncbi:MAG: hypothetical protein HY864_00780 [Chloroflexi bacterium]|nr:hypothetical protein [Chloroflexota bacterium]
MAKKSEPVEVVIAEEPVSAPSLWDGVTPILYEDLAQAKVLVKDKDGNLYYLEPANRSGIFVLRVLPQ